MQKFLAVFLVLVLFACKSTSSQRDGWGLSSSEDSGFWWVHFRDGSVLQGVEPLLEGRSFSFEHPRLFQRLSVDISQVSHLISTKITEKELAGVGVAEFLNKKEEGLLLKVDDSSRVDFFAGTVLSIKEQALLLSELQKPIALSKIAGIIFMETKNPFAKETLAVGSKDAQCWLETKAGELMFAKQLTSGSEQIELTPLLSFGGNAPTLKFPKELVTTFECPEAGKDYLLSYDLNDFEMRCEGRSIKEGSLTYDLCKPQILRDMTFSLPNNKAGPKEVVCNRGLQLVSTTSMGFKLKRTDYKSLSMKLVRIESEVASNVLVRFRNKSTGETLLERNLDQEKSTATIDLSLQKISALEVVVEDGGDGFLGDTICLCDAVLNY